jgi:hypothetical protein
VPTNRLAACFASGEALASASGDSGVGPVGGAAPPTAGRAVRLSGADRSSAS